MHSTRKRYSLAAAYRDCDEKTAGRVGTRAVVLAAAAAAAAAPLSSLLFVSCRAIDAFHAQQRGLLFSFPLSLSPSVLTTLHASVRHGTASLSCPPLRVARVQIWHIHLCAPHFTVVGRREEERRAGESGAPAPSAKARGGGDGHPHGPGKRTRK